MPTYEYRCTACGEHLEVVQRFTEDPLTVCPACGGGLRKVFSPVGIMFKGSGFYKTDSRGGGGRSTKAEPAAATEAKPSGGDTKTGDTKSAESTTGSTPAKKDAPAAPSASGSKVA